jgi:hypothetical protein
MANNKEHRHVQYYDLYGDFSQNIQRADAYYRGFPLCIVQGGDIEGHINDFPDELLNKESRARFDVLIENGALKGIRTPV